MYIYLWLYSPYGPWQLFKFLNLCTVDRTQTEDHPVASPLPTHRTQTQNKRTDIHASSGGFEPTIPVFERSKTVDALHCAATDIGLLFIQSQINENGVRP
jgi:hypothetical protein